MLVEVPDGFITLGGWVVIAPNAVSGSTNHAAELVRTAETAEFVENSAG